MYLNIVYYNCIKFNKNIKFKLESNLMKIHLNIKYVCEMDFNLFNLILINLIVLIDLSID